MHIGTVDIPGKLYLAPMAGVTDLAFRQICRELGADMSCTELVSAKALCYQDKKSRGLLKLAGNERPAAAQIFGSDIGCMAEAPPSRLRCPARRSSTSTWAAPWARWWPTATAPP